MRNLVHYIYVKPLYVILIVILFLVAVWTSVNVLLRQKKEYYSWVKGVNKLLLLCAILLVVYVTISSRTSEKKELCLIPFYSFVLAHDTSEMYRTMLMNVLLFVPFGLFLPYAQKESRGGKVKTTVLLAFLFSLCIEVLQFTLKLGRAEVDDVICNTFGAFIGSLSFVLYCVLEKRRNAKQKESVKNIPLYDGVVYEKNATKD